MIEQKDSGQEFPIYFPIAEYTGIFKITNEIYNLQLERLQFAQATLSGLIDQPSEGERAFLELTFRHLAKLITEKRILKNPKKLPGWMPVRLLGFDDKGREEFCWGDETGQGGSIWGGSLHSDETKKTSQKIVHSLMPEAEIEIFDNNKLLEKLEIFKRNGFSGGAHEHAGKTTQTRCVDPKHCLAGEHFLPTIVPAVLFYVEIAKVNADHKAKQVSIIFADSEYEENSIQTLA